MLLKFMQNFQNVKIQSQGVRLHGRSLPNFYFFNLNTQIFQQNRKVHLSNSLEINFHNISNIGLRVIRRRNYS